jgi:hypothetical protein
LAVVSWLAVVLVLVLLLLLLLLACWLAADGQAVKCCLCCLLRSFGLVEPAVLQSRGATTASAGVRLRKRPPFGRASQIQSFHRQVIFLLVIGQPPLSFGLDIDEGFLLLRTGRL